MGSCSSCNDSDIDDNVDIGDIDDLEQHIICLPTHPIDIDISGEDNEEGNPQQTIQLSPRFPPHPRPVQIPIPTTRRRRRIISRTSRSSFSSISGTESDESGDNGSNSSDNSDSRDSRDSDYNGDYNSDSVNGSDCVNDNSVDEC